MNITHVAAFMLGDIVQAVATIAFLKWDTRRKLRAIRRQVEAESIFDLDGENRRKP